MKLSKSVKKVTTGLALAASLSGAVGVSAWQIAANSQPAQTVAKSSSDVAGTTPDNTPTSYKITPSFTPGYSYGDSTVRRGTIQLYAYKLVGRFAQIEQSRYTQ